MDLYLISKPSQICELCHKVMSIFNQLRPANQHRLVDNYKYSYVLQLHFVSLVVKQIIPFNFSKSVDT